MSGTAPALLNGSLRVLGHNVSTHHFDSDCCQHCGAKLGGATALWECGARPPRVELLEMNTYFRALSDIWQRLEEGEQW